MLDFMATGQFLLWSTSSQLEISEMDLCQVGEMVNFIGLVARVGMGIFLLRSLEPWPWLVFLALLREAGTLGGDQRTTQLSNMLPSAIALTEAEETCCWSSGFLQAREAASPQTSSILQEISVTLRFLASVQAPSMAGKGVWEAATLWNHSTLSCTLWTWGNVLLVFNPTLPQGLKVYLMAAASGKYPLQYQGCPSLRRHGAGL